MIQHTKNLIDVKTFSRYFFNVEHERHLTSNRAEYIRTCERTDISTKTSHRNKTIAIFLFSQNMRDG
ncbi:hypothetical protein BC943DRAFT_28820 [Umbelopsis sp. AD052]|nr:hypothetical protein BC943DRAFT_28820 [Umbelopsis sp. AD052]